MKWTKEECAKEALKYKSRKEFSNNNHWAYQKSVKNKWIDDICGHMVIINHPNNYWNEEKCRELTLKYDDLRLFKEKYGYIYEKIKLNKWDYMLSHMKPVINKCIWTKERCIEIASKCKNKKEFRKKSEGAYRFTLQNNIMDEVSSHMEVLGNVYKRCVYVCKFEDNSIYVGLTYNFEIRKRDHLSGRKYTSVYKHIEKTGLTPDILKVTDYLDKKEAAKLENSILEDYKSKGFILLNIAKTGGLGGDILIWTKEKCIEAALNCKTIREFREKYPTAYTVSNKNKWAEEVCSGLIIERRKSGYWTKERCLEVALKYEKLIDFRKNDFSVYSAACFKGFREEICSHFVKK